VRLLLVQNCATEGFGRYHDRLVERGVACTTVAAYTGAAFPDSTAFDAVWVGGTPDSARELGRHPHLQQSGAFLRQMLDAGVPCFGICCGAQLLALLCGGLIERSPAPEIGVYQEVVTPSGRRDPLLQGFPDRFPAFAWHFDAFTVPPGGALLVSGDRCPAQMFRCGDAAGVLFHLEVNAAAAGVWADAYAGELEAVGKSRDDIVREAAAAESEMLTLADRLVDNFLAAS